MIRCVDQERGYPELAERAGRVAGGLVGLGLAPGGHVALVLRNCVEFLELSEGIGLAGASPVPVNWHWRGAELRHLLTDSGATVVFAHTEFVAAVLEAAPTEVRVIEVRLSPGVAQACGVAPVDPPGSVPEYESWLAVQPPLTEGRTSGGLGVIYTSGTTGRPKGIVRDQVGLEQMMQLAGALVGRMGLSPGGRMLVPAPLYHTAPNTAAVLAVKLRADITILPRFDPENFLAEVAQHRVEQVQMVPTMFVRLLRLPESTRSRYDLSTLRRVVHAAAPCSQRVKREIIGWFGPIVDEYYGGSETGPIVWCDSAEWLDHPGTVGAPIDGAAVRIVGPDGREVPTGEVGVVYVRSPEYWPNFSYLGDDDKRKAMELDGYVTVGDVGRVDGDGYLYLTDRASDMVISGGVNIYPAEIEETLADLPGVRDSAVFGIPDEEFGESLAAHIEVEPGSGLTADAVRDYVRRSLAGYKVPRVVEFTDELPREDSGKLFKRRLREPYWAGAGRDI
jgi:long-chain acyl-CoA synthetase